MHLTISSPPALLPNETETISLVVSGLKTISLMECYSWIRRHLYQRLKHLSIHLETGNQIF